MDKDSRFLSKSTGNLRHSERHPVIAYLLDLSGDKDSLAPFSVRRGSNCSALSESPTIRSRASSAASSGLDSSQVHLLLNKRDSRSSIFAANSSFTEPQSPTSVGAGSVSSTTPLLRGSFHEDVPEQMKKENGRERLPPRKVSAEKPHPQRKNIITVKPRNEQKARPMGQSRPGSPEQHRQLERTLTEPNLSMQPTMYLNEIIWQIDDLVFVGGVEASCNMNLLCRLNVTFFLDLTDDPDRKDNKTPCLCSMPSRHSRYMVDIKLPTENAAYWFDANGQQISMTDLYERFVGLTEKAIKAERKVLVFSNKGRNKAPAFAAAYLMHTHRISRAAAVGKVQKAMETMRPPVSISDYLQRSLMRYQVHKNIEVDSAYDSTHSTSIFRVPRTAWI